LAPDRFRRFIRSDNESEWEFPKPLFKPFVLTGKKTMPTDNKLSYLYYVLTIRAVGMIIKKKKTLRKQSD